MPKYFFRIFLLSLFTVLLYSCKTDREIKELEDQGINPVDSNGNPIDPNNPSGKPKAYKLLIPPFWPQPVIPADNPMTEEGVALGRKLFYDPLLSGNNQQFCGSCHNISNAFTDNGKKFSEGITGALGARNSMPLFNLAWEQNFFWDGRASSLEDQVIGPVTASNEMNQDTTTLMMELINHPTYPALFRKAFGKHSITFHDVARALAQFERTMISANSEFDKRYGRNKNLWYKKAGSLAEAQSAADTGMFWFYNTDPGAPECVHCHGNLGNQLFTNSQFMNNGLELVSVDPGREAITGNPDDKGRFKVPSLRNISMTAPYMHDGKFETLEEVMEFYNNELRNSANLDFNLRPHINNKNRMSKDQVRTIIAFLKTLNDSTFINNPAFKPAM